MGGNKVKDSKQARAEAEESSDSEWAEPNYSDKEWFKRESCKCQHCNQTFDTPADASKCITSGHKRLRCYFCFATVKNTEELFRHFTARHNKNKGGKESVTCPYCEATVPYKSVSCHVISIHMTNCTNGQPPKKSSNGPKSNGSGKKKGSGSEDDSEEDDSAEESEDASFTEESDSDSRKENVRTTRAKRAVKRPVVNKSEEDSEEEESDEEEPVATKKNKNGKKMNSKKEESASESENEEEDSEQEPKVKKGKHSKTQKKGEAESSNEEMDKSSDEDSDYNVKGKGGKSKKPNLSRGNKGRRTPIAKGVRKAATRR